LLTISVTKIALDNVERRRAVSLRQLSCACLWNSLPSIGSAAFHRNAVHKNVSQNTSTRCFSVVSFIPYATHYNHETEARRARRHMVTSAPASGPRCHICVWKNLYIRVRTAESSPCHRPSLTS